MDKEELDLNNQDRVVKQLSDLLLEKESKLEELKMLHQSQPIIQGKTGAGRGSKEEQPLTRGVYSNSCKY